MCSECQKTDKEVHTPMLKKLMSLKIVLVKFILRGLERMEWLFLVAFSVVEVNRYFFAMSCHV